MIDIEDITDGELTRNLAYAGFVLVGFEIVKGMIVNPIKLFYKDVTFHGGTFKSYEEDVLSRHKNVFEASLLYLRDFMEAIDSEDMLTIQSLRKHRNDLAHALAGQLADLKIEDNRQLFQNVERAILNLSRHRVIMEIGADPEFQDIDWATAIGPEYVLFSKIVEKVRLLDIDTEA